MRVFAQRYSTGQLAQAVRLAHQGLFQIDAGVAGKIVGTLTNNLPIFSQGCPDELSGQSINISSRAKRVEERHKLSDRREREVLRLIAMGQQTGNC
jgi:DNA-binding NarL/FixJ family response regulator